MVCTNYQYKRKIVDNDQTYYVVYAELYSTDTPSSLTIDATGIDNFPQIWPKDKVKFQVGSYIYVVSTGSLYMSNEDFTFVLQ